MTAPLRHPPATAPGAVPVADMRALPPLEGMAVLFLRDWAEGAAGQARVRSVLTGTLGAGPGTVAADAFAALVGRLASEGRRPLMRHATTCTCVGADEAVFANLLAVAATGDREDAMMIASLLVPADRMILIAREAEIAGLAIARVGLIQPPEPHPTATLH